MKTLTEHQEFLRLFKFANFSRKIGNIDDSINFYLKALKIDSSYPEVLNNLGYVLYDQEQYSRALFYFRSALKLDSERNIFHHNVAMAYSAIGFKEQAKFHYKRSIFLSPEYIQSYYNLAGIYREEKKISQAVLMYQKVIENNCDLSVDAEFMIDIMTNKNSINAPSSYLTRLFNSYASYYDRHMKSTLYYAVPKIFSEILSSNKRKVFKNGLDIGCGTGLCGVIMKPYVVNLMGIDLAEKMIIQASRKNCYDKLVHGNFIDDNQFLLQQKFDLIISGDVFIYSGDLSKIFKRLSELIENESEIIFNVELGDHEYFELRNSGRFSHSARYIKTLLLDNNFKLISFCIKSIRKENCRNITGGYFHAQYCLNEP